MINDRIDQKALRKAIYHNTGWNFMCKHEYIEEINAYCEGAPFESMSNETLRQLNGIYTYIAEDYSYFSDGGYLPNIFIVEEDR